MNVTTNWFTMFRLAVFLVDFIFYELCALDIYVQ